MALCECPECKAEVSSFAKACPRCGFPLIVRKITQNKELKFPEIKQEAKDEFSWILQSRFKNHIKLIGKLVIGPCLLSLIPFGGLIAFIWVLISVRHYCKAFTFKTLSNGCDLSNLTTFYIKTYFAFALRVLTFLIYAFIFCIIFLIIFDSHAGRSDPAYLAGNACGPTIWGLITGLLFSLNTPRQFTKKNLTNT